MHSSKPNRPRAKDVWFADNLIHVELVDGRVVSARYDAFPRILTASAEERNHWEIIGAGVGIHWSIIDEDLSTEGLLRDAVAVKPAPSEAQAS